jgi:hypothetical protein
MRFKPHAVAILAAVLASLAVAPRAQQKQLDPVLLAESEWRASDSWRDFLRDHGGEWSVTWSAATGTPKAIWGSGVPLPGWRENSLVEARRHAVALLESNRELLRLGGSELREQIGARMHRIWSFKFQQFYHDLEVVGGRADVRVHMKGRVPMFGSTAVQIPDDFVTTPAINGEAAWLIAWQDLGEKPSLASQPAMPAMPRLVIYADVQSQAMQTPKLAYEVAISNVEANGEGSIGRSYVDALTGKVIAFVSDKHECGFPGCTLATHRPAKAAVKPLIPVPTTVTVMGWTRIGDDAYDPLVNVPMPGLEISVPNIGTVITDANGQFVIDITTSTTISLSGLNGRHHALVSGNNAPAGSWTVTPGVAATIQLLTSSASTNEGAHTTVSWWTDLTNEWTRAILGNSPQLDTASNIGITVNRTSTCNAYYTGNTINFYQAGGGCANTAFSTVVSHEWGHGLDDRYGGISQTDGLSEGWGDIVGLYIVDSPILGSGFQTSGVGIRNGNNTTQYPCGGCGVHTAGQSWMGFAWKLRNRLETTYGSRATAISISNSIVVSTVVADATNQQDAVFEVFVADDDDGNLSNGTPNYTDLVWACDQHSLPYPGQPGLPNDECVDAIALTAGVNGPFSSSGAFTSSPSWPCASGGSDVWFSVDITGSGTLSVTTCGYASWDTAMQLFSGSCGSLSSIVCNDDDCGSYRSTVSATVSPGTYYVRVGGYSSATGSFSLDVVVPSSPPDAPSGLSATVNGTDQISVAWTDNSSDESGFSLERATGGGGFTIIANLGANATSYTDNGLQPGTSYSYRVAAFNTAGSSGYSNTASATTSLPNPPAAPSGLNAAATSETTVSLSWLDNSSDEDNFIVERSLDGTSFALIATVGVNATAYVDAGLNSGTTYSYRVAAINVGGSSGYSNAASATTPTPQPPTAPSGAVATGASSSSIDVAWVDNSSNEIGFAVERADAGLGNWSQIISMGSNATSFTDTGLQSATSYDYRIRAFNGAGSSSPSNVATATTDSFSSQDYFVTSESPGAGTVSGTYQLTLSDDGQSQEILERRSGGKPSSRYSYMSHTFVIPVSSGSSLTLHANAWHSVSPDDDFELQWSVDNVSFASAILVTATSDGTTYTASLPATLNGNVYIRVVDTDRTSGNLSYDTVYIDQLFIRSSGITTPTAPNAPSNASAAAPGSNLVNVSWTDNAFSELSFDLQRSTDGVNFASLATLPTDSESYADSTVSSLTKYWYRVRAVNTAGASAWANSGSVTTPGAGSADDTANGETSISGDVTGSYLDTATLNGVSEQIRELRTGGPPSQRVSYMEHDWTFNVTGGSSVEFLVRAWQSNSSDDNFRFSWSTDGVNFQPMLTITGTSDPGSYDSFTLPAGTVGLIYVKAEDTDRTPGNGSRDRLYIDHMFVRSQ